MGYSGYDSHARSVRTSYYASANMDQVFTQTHEKKIHELMSPAGITFRESRDSELHPLTVPIQLYLDVTGSMGGIPKQMIKTGLPTLMSSLIQNGVKDAALMFGAIGDHECDRYPLQIAQFESGDLELDQWLTRTYLEGGGGGNAGESYLLAWYFAAHHTKTDAWDKRKTKGFVFTVGDEPCLKQLPIAYVKHIMQSTAVGQLDYGVLELLTMAEATNHVYHIHIAHHGPADHSWRQLLGSRLIELKDHNELARTISDIILSHHNETVATPTNNGPEPTNIL